MDPIEKVLIHGEDEEHSPAAKIISGVLVALFFVISHALIEGLTTKLLWSWFVVPIFNLPELSIAQALGIGLLLAHLTHQIAPTLEGSKLDKLKKVLMHIYAKPFSFILIGYLVSFWL